MACCHKHSTSRDRHCELKLAWPQRRGPTPAFQLWLLLGRRGSQHLGCLGLFSLHTLRQKRHKEQKPHPADMRTTAARAKWNRRVADG